jgi:hypothetical protein
MDELSRMKWKLDQFESYADRMRRSSREIIIAAVLTVAAFAFLLAAMFGGAVGGNPKVGAIVSEEIAVQ